MNPETLAGIGVSLRIVFAVVLGGMYTLLGPTVGTALTVALSEYLRIAFGIKLVGMAETIYGLVLDPLHHLPARGDLREPAGRAPAGLRRPAAGVAGGSASRASSTGAARPRAVTWARRTAMSARWAVFPDETRRVRSRRWPSRSSATAGRRWPSTAIPWASHWHVFCLLPMAKVEPTPYQRDLSPTHAKRLQEMVKKIDRFVDPIVAMSPSPGVYWTPNGNHRRVVLEKLKAQDVPAILVPEPEVAFQILALNTEKAHNLKEKSLEVIRMYRGLAVDEPDARRGGLRRSSSRRPTSSPSGVLYEGNKRFSGGAFAPILRRVDKFLKGTFRDTLGEREERAGLVAGGRRGPRQGGGQAQEARHPASLREELRARAHHPAHPRAQDAAGLRADVQEAPRPTSRRSTWAACATRTSSAPASWPRPRRGLATGPWPVPPKLSDAEIADRLTRAARLAPPGRLPAPRAHLPRIQRGLGLHEPRGARAAERHRAITRTGATAGTG